MEQKYQRHIYNTQMQEKYKRNLKKPPFILKQGMKVMVHMSKKYQQFSNKRRYGVMNVPGYIITKLLSHGRANIREINSGLIIKDISQTKLIPYNHDTLTCNELSGHGLYETKLANVININNNIPPNDEEYDTLLDTINANVHDIDAIEFGVDNVEPYNN